MNAPRLEKTLTISELFSALEAKIVEEISIARSGRNPFSAHMMEELDCGTRQLLVRLNELKNSRQPIQQLPPDVIIEVATYLNPRACDGDYQPLVAMSQVCRYWRESLLSDAKSWSFISNEVTKLLPLFLERSRLHSLEINLTMDTLLPDIIQHIGPYTGRLGVLRCHLEEADIVALQSLSQLNSTPLLRTFSIKIGTPPDFSPEVIGMALFSGEMPTLHTLELLPFPLTPQFAEFKHLVDLRLDVRYSTLTSVLDLLSANPSLEKVRLLGNFEDDEDTREAGSVSMKHLRSFTVERCTPCLFLDKLTFLPKARVFIRCNLIPHLIPFAYALPQSIGRYQNLQGLSSLYALMTCPGNVYIDATGPNGSIAIQYTGLQDGLTLSDAIVALPRTGVTQLTCESHPDLAGGEIVKVVRIMDHLPHLEEIILIHFCSADIKKILSILENANEWTNLRRLKFVHCRQIAEWIGRLVTVAERREDENLMLDTVTIVFGEGEGDELFDVLKALVGTLERVKEEAGQMLTSAAVWDDVSCTTTRVCVPMRAN